MKNRWFIIVLIFFPLTVYVNGQTLNARIMSGDAGSETTGMLRAGAATANMTPFLGSNIVGGWTSPPATHVHDELHARCLVLDDSITRLVFVTIDVVGVSKELTDEAKRIILEETGIPKENVVISAVHTHSAACVRGKHQGWNSDIPYNDYQKFVIRRIADVVRIAINNLEPAKIGWGVGSVPEHVFVRRFLVKPGTAILNPFGVRDKARVPGTKNSDLLKPIGKPDPEVSFISVQSAKGRPIALLANYSTHYAGGVPSGHISADYFAVFADRIQEMLKADRQDPPFVGIMTNGTSGDVITTSHMGPSIKRQPYENQRLVAENLAQEVFRLCGSVSYQDRIKLQSKQAVLSLKVRKPDRKMVEYAKMIRAKPDTVKPVHMFEKIYAERTFNMLEWPDNIDVILQAFRIGDLGIATMPFEAFAEIGLEIKAKSPFKPSFTIDLANGSFGYLPTPEQHKLGGYETWIGTNKVEINASEKIVSTLLGLFNELY